AEVIDSMDAPAEAVEAGADLAIARSRRDVDQDGEVLRLRPGERLHRPVRLLRARAGDHEPAAREVVGLAKRERYGGDDREQPDGDHERAPALDERRELVHGAL